MTSLTRPSWQNYTAKKNAFKLKNRATLPSVDTTGNLLDGPSFLQQLLRHVLQILPVVPVRILQEVVAGRKQVIIILRYYHILR